MAQASTTDFSLPARFNNQDLPSLASLQATDVSDEANTVRWFNTARDHFTKNSAPIFDSSNLNVHPLKRLAKVKLIQKRTGKEQFDVKLERPQTADSLVKYLYGEERVGSRACTRCKGGKGTPWEGCVLLNDISGGCASCHYQGKARDCSLNKSAKRKNGDDDDDDDHKRRKINHNMRDREIIKALQTIPSKHLKTFVDVMESLITKREESGDFSESE